MFELDLTENRQILRNFLNIGDIWFFHNGTISVLHKGLRIAYAELRVKGMKTKNSLNKAESFDGLLRSKTISTATISPKSGKIAVKRPYHLKKPLDRIDNEQMFSDFKAFRKIKKSMKGSGSHFKDHRGGRNKKCRFTIDNVTFRDMLDQLGDGERLEIMTGEKLTLHNAKNGVTIRYPKITTEEKVSISLGTDVQDYLANALIGEKSDIVIANTKLLLVINQCDTLLAGRLE